MVAGNSCIYGHFDCICSKNILVVIPYELVKIYRDIGINLFGRSIDTFLGNDFEYFDDSFIYDAF